MFSWEKDTLHASGSGYVKFVWVVLDLLLSPVSFFSPDMIWFSDYHIQQRRISTKLEYFITIPHISSAALLFVAGRFSNCNYLKLSKIN